MRKPVVIPTVSMYDKVLIEDSPTHLTRLMLTVGEDPAIEYSTDEYRTTVVLEEDDVRALVYALNRWLGRDQS